MLAKAGRKVCVIERNHSIGGAASAFKVGALRIEPSLHQTADPRDRFEPKYAILEELGLLDDIEWTAVSPFHSVRGELVGGLFDLPVGFDAAREALEARFPNSRAGIAGLLTRSGPCKQALRIWWKRDPAIPAKLARAGMELRGLIRDWRLSVDEILQRYLGDDEGAKFASRVISATTPTIREIWHGRSSPWRKAVF